MIFAGGILHTPSSQSVHVQTWRKGHAAGDLDLDFASPATQLGCIGTDTDEVVSSRDNEPWKFPGVSRPHVRGLFNALLIEDSS